MSTASRFLPDGLPRLEPTPPEVFFARRTFLRLRDVRFAYHRAADFQTGGQDFAGVDLTLPLAYLLIAMIVGEQLLAYAASYHPPRRGGTRR